MPRRPTTSLLRTVLIVVLLVSVGQVSWWIADNIMFSTSVRDGVTDLYVDEVAAATEMIGHGVPVDSVLAGFPNLVLGGDSVFSINPALIDSLADLSSSRINRMGWEGAFFLAVLLASLWMMAYAIREDSRFRRRQRNFVAAVTHELKSPLASLQLAAETLSIRDQGPEDRQRLTARMMDDLARLNGLVTNVLDASRLERGDVRAAVDISLTDEVNLAVGEMAGSAASMGIELESSIDTDAFVHADSLGVRTALRNVLNNALKATTDVEDATINVSVRVRGASAAVIIADNGVGFPPEDAKRLFERFYRPGNEMTREMKGTGLGLYIVERVMAGDGGVASAHSDGPGKGARFTLTWPAVENSR